jgi:hypothetical protein
MRQIIGEYVEHVGSTRDSAGTVFAAVSHHNRAAKRTDCVIFRFGLDGSATEIFRFDEARYGKAGHCTLEVLPDGTLWCGLSVRNNSGQQSFAVELLPGQAAPYGAGAPAFAASIQAPAPTQNVDGEARRVAEEAKKKAERALDLAKGGGGLSRAEVEAIAWQKGRDAVQALINEAEWGESALGSFVWKKAMDAAWATLQQHQPADEGGAQQQG